MSVQVNYKKIRSSINCNSIEKNLRKSSFSLYSWICSSLSRQQTYIFAYGIYSRKINVWRNKRSKEYANYDGQILLCKLSAINLISSL